jgi:hypothetical protein
MNNRPQIDSELAVELREQIEECKNVLSSYNFDFEDCEADEKDCYLEHGKDLFRLYELFKEAGEITKGS